MKEKTITVELLNTEVVNKDIAEFMGFVVVPSGTKTMGEIKEPEIAEAFLKYHKSWDELMPVLEKIENMGHHISINSWWGATQEEMQATEKPTCIIDICEKKNSFNAVIPRVIAETKIEAVYKAVYDFITNHKNK